MAYNRKKILEQAKKAIEKHHLFFIEDIVAYLPITKKTFYEWWPVDSDECNDLKSLLEIEKINMKVKLRAKLYNSKGDTATLALYKLICTDEERQNLSTNWQKNEDSSKIFIDDLSVRSTEEIIERAKAVSILEKNSNNN